MVNRSSFALATLLLLAPILPADLTAQSQVGVRLGVSYSLLGGEGFAGSEFLGGLLGGVFARASLSEHFAFQPEAIFTKKGTKDTSDGIDVIFEADYLEVPLQLMWLITDDDPMASVNNAYVSFGAALGFDRGCAFGVRSQGASIDLTCDSASDELDVQFASPDVGALLGGGGEGRVGSVIVSFDVRMVVGLDDEAITLSTTQLSASGRNFSMSASVGVALPIG